MNRTDQTMSIDKAKNYTQFQQQQQQQQIMPNK